MNRYSNLTLLHIDNADTINFFTCFNYTGRANHKNVFNDDNGASSPADDDEELDEQQRVGGAAVGLHGAGEVERAVP